MEAVYYAARANLRRLMILHPSWTRTQLAQATGMSRSWVDTWRKRLLSVPADDEQVLHGLSRAPHHPPPRLDPQVVDRLLEIRDDPPEAPGPPPRPPAMQQWHLDFKDASTVPADPHGKKQHVVETLTIIDKGTSILVAHHVRADFTAETALAAVAQT